MENIFKPNEELENIVAWIREWINTNTPDHKIVIGLSGGKDSTIVAALCARAIGPENVIGVAMPGTGQGINDADKIAKHIGIQFMEAPIGGLELQFKTMFEALNMDMSAQTQMNIPPRLRMTTLYAIA